MKKYYAFIALLILVAAAAVAAQSITAQKPLADRKKVEDLNRLRAQIENYARANDRLPGTLQRAAERSDNGPSLDPGESLNNALSAYEYRTLDRDTYELCATFETERKNPYATRYEPEPGYFNAEYHGRGRQCFTGDVHLPTAPFRGNLHLDGRTVR